MKARLYNSPLLQELLDEITPEEMEATKQQMLRQIMLETKPNIKKFNKIIYASKCNQYFKDWFESKVYAYDSSFTLYNRGNQNRRLNLNIKKIKYGNE